MPVQVSVRVEGDDKIRAGLNRWARTLEPVSREVIQEHMKRAMKRSIPYLGGASYGVPERGYVRTGNLGRSAYVEQTGLTTTIKVQAYNQQGREYGRYVVGGADGEGQAYMHAGWWMTLRDSVDAELDELTGDVDAAIGDSAEAVGL